MRARLQLLRLFQIAHSGEKQKTQQAIREIVRDGQSPSPPANRKPIAGQMQRQIMKYGQNPETCEMRDQGLPALRRGHDHIKHVVSLFEFKWDDREPGSVRVGPGS